MFLIYIYDKETQISPLFLDAISFVKEGYKTFTWNDARLPQVLKSKGERLKIRQKNTWS